MPIIDVVLVAAAQTRLHFLLPLAVPHLDRVGRHPYLHVLADQPRRHRVDVPFDADRAARLHAHLHDAERLLSTRRQRMQVLAFVDELLRSRLVPSRAHIVQKGHIGFLAGKVVTATQEQRLLHRLLEAIVTLLSIAVLVTLAGVDRLRLHSVVRHQRLVPACELLGARILHRQAHTVGAMLNRYTAQGPHRILEARAETLEALGETERDVLPVRVGQDEVIHQMRERLALDGHAQLRHVREVRGAELTGPMLLGEEHLLGRPVCCPPLLDVPLQGAELALGEATGMPTLHLLEEGLGLPASGLFEQLDNLAPNVRERVCARPPVARRRAGLPLRR